MTTKPTNADDGGATIDRAAALAAKLRNAVGWPSIVDTAIIQYSVVQEVIAELEASRPAQDIVAEMRELAEKIHKEAVNYESEQEFIIIKHADFDLLMMSLSPTKNPAPTEAEI